MSWHDHAGITYLFVNGKEIFKFKASSENNNFLSQFCIRSISNIFDRVDTEEVTFKENIMTFKLIMMLLRNLTLVNI